MPEIFYFLLMIFSGVFVALQPPINAALAQKVGALQSALISFAVGTAALLLVSLAYGHGSFKGLSGTHWWQFTGGLLGAFFVTAIIFAVPRIGVLAALSAAIATQLAAGAVLDHFGLLGGRQVSLDAWRVLGIILLFAGSALALR